MAGVLDRRYPIGTFTFQGVYPQDQLIAWVKEFQLFPGKLSQEVKKLTEAQLEEIYRPDSWTVRQLVHHLADSHINSYTRFRLALTEENPVIRPYEEGKWAELVDAKSGPIEVSIQLLEAVHNRWAILAASLSETDWKRTWQHPESGQGTIGDIMGLYVWHSNHHFAHIQLAFQGF